MQVLGTYVQAEGGEWLRTALQPVLNAIEDRKNSQWDEKHIHEIVSLCMSLDRAYHSESFSSMSRFTLLDLLLFILLLSSLLCSSF